MKWVLIKIMYSEIKNLPTIQETLKKNKVKINKALGQNFLFDLNITDKIVKQTKPVAIKSFKLLLFKGASNEKQL